MDTDRKERKDFMSTVKECLEEMMKIDGAMAVSIVDATSGFMLGSEGKGLDLEFASAGNTELYHTKQKIMSVLGINERVEDFLIELESQIHILYPIAHLKDVFVYFVMKKDGGTLALARRGVRTATAELAI